MMKGKIVSLVTLAGEYIGKFMEENNGNITLENPRMLVNAPDGKVGFARGISVTPKAGRLLMFPPVWTHLHAGRKVTGDTSKYIVGSYLHYI